MQILTTLISKFALLLLVQNKTFQNLVVYNCFIRCLDSVGQEFRQGTEEINGLYYTVSWASVGMTAGGWNHLMESLLTCLVFDASCWVGPQLEPSRAFMCPHVAELPHSMAASE